MQFWDVALFVSKQLEHGYIFAREDGHPQLRKVVETWFKRLLKKVGIKET
jgi:hypothetical protein